MCGIAGFIEAGQAEWAGNAVRAMVSALQRRGPDSEGIHAWADATLGHRRLAILDLSPAGAQPMLSADGTVGLVFNGCIYNFRELRRELELLGIAFHSHCDTEVLLEGYRAWGIRELTRKIQGMFAFAIWDAPQEKLFLVRDRLGVKPLVYAAAGNRIAFASTIDALRAAKLTGAVDADAVLQFLEFGFVLDTSSIFEGVQKLPPATVLEWQGGRFETYTYWELPEPSAEAGNFEDAVDRTESLLVEAVRMRLVADVPVGALLSGGIDSTLICWAMAKLNANITAFTVAAPGDADDEAGAAAMTARALGIDHCVVPLPEAAPVVIDNLIAAFSEPFAVHSALGMLLVSQAVRPRAKVLLTGDGGDDVFLGYPFLHNAWRAQRVAGLLPPGAGSLWGAMRGLVPWRRARNFLDYSTAGLAGHAQAHDGLPWFEARGLLGPQLQGRALAARSMQASSESARSLLSEVLRYHQNTHFTSEFLPKVDGGTMYHGIEARSPLLDQALWELAASLPYSLRMRGGELKAVLRAIVRKRVGPQIASRRKQGFSIPLERRLAGAWKQELKSLTGVTLLEEQGWLSAGQLRRVVDEAQQASAVPVQIWRLLVLERWLCSRT